MKRVLSLAGDGGEGYKSVVAVPSRRRLHRVLPDFEPGCGVNADAAIADVTAEGFDAVLIPGGRAPVRGRKVSCYEHVRTEDALAGGEWQSEQSVRDGRMVTAQTWESHPEFNREGMACLAS